MATLKCRQCGYDVTSLASVSGEKYQCPECGDQRLPLNPECSNVQLWSWPATLIPILLPPLVSVIAWLALSQRLGASVGAIGFVASPLVGAVAAGLIASVIARRRATIARRSRFSRFMVPAFLIQFTAGLFAGLISAFVTAAAWLLFSGY